MIIYSLVCNEGGMLRVVESLKKVFDYLPKDFPLKVFIFSTQVTYDFKDNRFVWFSLDSSSAQEWTKSYERLSQEVSDYLKGVKVDWIVADFMTLEFYENIKAKLCYDIHFLGKPFYKALDDDPKSMLIDKFLGSKFILSLHLNQFTFLRKEYKFLKRASRFISNSPSTTLTLKEMYRDVCEGKEITYIPVSSALEESREKVPTLEKNKFYFHGRCHPQKGIQYLIEEDWKEGLTMRGFDQKILSEDRTLWLKEKGISALPWTGDSSCIKTEVLSHEVILFPSIYEPWGLSLQESLALGKICIANKGVGGYEDQIEDGVNGFLIDFSSGGIEQRVLTKLDENKSRLMKIRLNAQKHSCLGHSSRQKLLADYFLSLS